MLLKSIVNIRSGLHQQPSPEGNIRYLQASDLLATETEQPMEFTYIEESKSTTKHLLEKGDVLLAAKGNRNFAWAYTTETGTAVASTFFVVLHLITHKVLPEYLAIFLNLPATQHQLQAMGGGNFAPVLRKSDLQDLSVIALSLEKQQKIVQLHKLHQQKVRLQKQIMECEEAFTQAIFHQLTF